MNGFNYGESNVTQNYINSQNVNEYGDFYSNDNYQNNNNAQFEATNSNGPSYDCLQYPFISSKNEHYFGDIPLNSQVNNELSIKPNVGINYLPTKNNQNGNVSTTIVKNENKFQFNKYSIYPKEDQDQNFQGNFSINAPIIKENKAQNSPLQIQLFPSESPYIDNGIYQERSEFVLTPSKPYEHPSIPATNPSKTNNQIKQGKGNVKDNNKSSEIHPEKNNIQEKENKSINKKNLNFPINENKKKIYFKKYVEFNNIQKKFKIWKKMFLFIQESTDMN